MISPREPVHHEKIRVHLPGHHRFAQPVIGIDDGLIEAVVERVERKGHPGAVGIHLLLDDHRDARLVKPKAMFFFVEKDPLIETGGKRMADGRFDIFHRHPQRGFVAAGKGGAFQIFFRRR